MTNSNNEMNVICSQLLTKNDLNISDEIFNKVIEDGIVTSISQNEDLKSIQVFSKTKIYLSSITPILHDIGFEIIDEVTYNIEKDKTNIYISRFNLNLDDISKMKKAKINIEKVITTTLLDPSLRHSKVFTLVYEQNFKLGHVKIIQAIIEYLDQAVLTINSAAILNTLKTHHNITNSFVEYFLTKFDPSCTKAEDKLKNLDLEIEELIKNVPQIMDDRILKLTYSLLKSLLRTNYFLYKETLSFKIDIKTFGKNLKGLQPNLENFVYHKDFYGVHLRMSTVSRGGLRWSDRHEDYRQEVKSLMITQEGKNSIIIPDGSKGGFVINACEISKELFENVYTLYINSMLDLVDNMVDGEIVKDKKIVAYDGDDAYFVVAADKGTASMSDVANAIAIKRGYWLGDAFASGGSNGYGHKDLGITARGSLMSTKRFFIEENIDIYKDEVTIVGLGSMNGDVFGNGLIESKTFVLKAAISQKEIFIDPTPKVKESYDERVRLFNAKKSGWSLYNEKLISEGGGVYLRSAKEIKLTSQVKKMLGISTNILSGEELARELLCMNVDMLFNGGVGTYVKASSENSLDIGDKQNEAVRVNANELNARIICEGGNLGFTQKARIEYALLGGKINIDGIDNAGGVDTSDREVNIKILLNTIENKGLCTKEEAKTTLHNLTSNVVDLVLESNYKQALVISIDQRFSKRYLNEFIRVIEVLENNITGFTRTNFFIPKNENINEILDTNESIVRPVLSSLLSYSKIFLTKLLMKSTFIDEPYALQFLYKYFPKSFAKGYENEIKDHPLRRKIIATKIADFIINSEGCTFVSDYERLGQDRYMMKIKAYLIINELFDAPIVRDIISNNDYKMDVEQQYRLINKLEYSLYASTRWMVKYLKNNQLDAIHILDHKEELFSLLGEIHTSEIEVLIEGEDKFNLFFSVIDYLRFAVAAINIKENTTHSFKDVMALFYMLIHEFNILEIIIALNRFKITTKSDMTLRNQVLQFIEFIVVHYTKKVLDFQRVNEKPEIAFKNFVENEQAIFNKVRKNLDIFMEKENKDIKDIAITVNQLMVSLI